MTISLWRQSSLAWHREEVRGDNKDQAAWQAYRETLEDPAELFVGWQNAKGTQFSLCSAQNEQPPPSVEPLEAVWFFKATSWAEANRAWYMRDGWTKAG